MVIKRNFIKIIQYLERYVNDALKYNYDEMFHSTYKWQCTE